ncbi:hypothetical protein JOD43_002286 [Pullulanibacillus pueri]|uniref:Uncharacterized protein n=1 Tax=Pullulanibacillus pueri TaxID=1437324 RepID=A0A8J2ZUS0_9BACL|nr:hypothetical protein [Pullulanibacillus pueri]MBM7682113.1 hypothetical protein [Pullulanibacillus pueri]GGH79929.1 hypothetical protein GCM10007096_15580 [Pullulanibacillus pueri]
MKSKQLMLELMLLNEKYSTEDIRAVRHLLEEKHTDVLNCLQALHKLSQGEQSESRAKPKQEKKRPTNLKSRLTELKKENTSKYNWIKHTQELLEDTQNVKLEAIRNYARELNLPLTKGTKRPALIRQIIIALIERPTDKMIPFKANPKQVQTNSLEILSQAIISNAKTKNS